MSRLVIFILLHGQSLQKNFNGPEILMLHLINFNILVFHIPYISRKLE